MLHKTPNTVGEHTIKSSSFHKTDTVNHVLSTLKKEEDSWPNSEFIYVVDTHHRLIGIVPFRKIVTSEPETILENIMLLDFPTLSLHAHQETAAKLAIKEKLENIPVVDQDGIFVGIVDASEIFKILHEDHIERLMKYTGILNTSVFLPKKQNSVHIVISRLPWLMIGLLGGIFSTNIIEYFGHTLEKQIELAFFIPLIVYVNAAVGNQTQTVFIRNTTFESENLKKGILGEMKIGLMIGIVMSLIIFVYSFIVHESTTLARIISISMFAGIMSSAVIATAIPWTFEKIEKDPAIGSGPISTIIQDVVSVVIYFSVASLLL